MLLNIIQKLSKGIQSFFCNFFFEIPEEALEIKKEHFRKGL
jgi:hypothetical protein